LVFWRCVFKTIPRSYIMVIFTWPISNACEVSSGVPQKCVLLLLINDIDCMFGDDVTVKLFADDLKMCHGQ